MPLLLSGAVLSCVVYKYGNVSPHLILTLLMTSCGTYIPIFSILQMTATVTSSLHDLLTTNRGRSDNGSTHSNHNLHEWGNPDAVPHSSTFTCYNSSHHLTLVGHNTSFYVTKIVKRYKCVIIIIITLLLYNKIYI